MADVGASSWDIWLYGDLGRDKRPDREVFGGPSVRLSGSRGHTARGKALNESMFSSPFFPPLFPLFLSSLVRIRSLNSHVIVKPTYQPCKFCLLLID